MLSQCSLSFCFIFTYFEVFFSEVNTNLKYRGPSWKSPLDGSAEGEGSLVGSGWRRVCPHPWPPLKTHIVDGGGLPLSLRWVGWETGLDSGPTWGLKDDQQGGQRDSRKPTSHKKGNKAIPARRGKSEKVSPLSPRHTRPSKADPGPKPESPPSSWLSLASTAAWAASVFTGNRQTCVEVTSVR